MSDTIVRALPVTVELTVGALVVALLVAIPFGLLLVSSRSKLLDRLGALYSLVGMSIAPFWLGIALLLFFTLKHDWFPPAGYVALSKNPTDNLSHMLLPMIAVGLPTSAVLVHMIRSAILGPPPPGLAFLRIFASPGLLVATVLSQILVIETLFSLPGLGGVTVLAISSQDRPMIRSIAVLFAGFAVIVGVVGYALRLRLSPDPTFVLEGGVGSGEAGATSGFLGGPWWIVGAIITGLLVLVAIFAPLLSPHGPMDLDFTAILKGPSPHHPLGTDNLGRDILSRLIFGTRDSFGVSALAVAIALVVGVPIGLIARGFAGSVGRWVIMPLADVVQAFPFLFLAVVLTYWLDFLSGSFGWVSASIAIGVGLIPAFVRAAGTHVLTLPGPGYAESHAGRLGTAIVAQTAMSMAAAVLADAAINFIGLGEVPPNASWGGTLMDTVESLSFTSTPAWFWAGLAIALAAFGFILLGASLPGLFIRGRSRSGQFRPRPAGVES